MSVFILFLVIIFCWLNELCCNATDVNFPVYSVSILIIITMIETKRYEIIVLSGKTQSNEKVIYILHFEARRGYPKLIIYLIYI